MKTSSPCFNPRPRTGGDIDGFHAFPPLTVSIRAPARGATTDRNRQGGTDHVSIRAPARGATRQHGRAPDAEKVSIRAPARGATRELRRGLRVQRVSIRAPARGATGSMMPVPEITMFQSAPPHGGRPAV